MSDRREVFRALASMLVLAAPLIVKAQTATTVRRIEQPWREELVRLKVEMILTNRMGATLAAKNATSTVPS